MGKTAIEGARRGNVFYVDPETLVVIGIDTKHKRGEHPLWDVSDRTTEIEQPTVDNIKVYGVHTTILVVKEPDGALVVSDGRRRTLHAREANKQLRKAGEHTVDVPVMLVKGDEKRIAGIMVSANEHRRGDDPITKAQKAVQLLGYGKSEAEVANDFKVDVQTIRTWIRVLEATPAVRKAVEAGELAPTAAAQIAKLPKEEQSAAVAEVKEAAKANGKTRATVADARAVTNAKSGRAENVGISSRKVLKQIRASYAEVSSSVDGAEYRRGVIDTLNLVLGDVEKLTGEVAKAARKVAKKLDAEAES